MEQQIQVALSCFSAGVSITSSLSIGGFDTHGNHDATHTPSTTTGSLVVTFARQEAERLGLRIACIFSSVRICKNTTLQ